MDESDMIAFFQKLDKEQEQLRTNVLKAVWSMRGGISLDEAYQLSLKDLSEISQVTKENYEIAKKIKMAHF